MNKTINRIDSLEIQPYEIEHTQLLRDIAPECMVLLKNSGVLPVKRKCKIALYGSGARKTIKGGTGSGDVNVRGFISVEEALEDAGFQVTTKTWLDEYDKLKEQVAKEFYDEIVRRAEAAGINTVIALAGQEPPEPEYELPLDGDGDLAVYVLARISGEGADRSKAAGDISLTKTEIRDILTLNKKYKHFILVLNVGGLVDLSPVEEVRTVLLLGQLGMTTGTSFADVLCGESYPSGKLATSWAALEQYSSTKNFGDINDTRYKEGIYVGYRYFDTSGEKVKYPFGFGLGYTEFKIETKSVSLEDKKVCITVSVKNEGNHKGKEVVQIYFSAPQGQLDKPFQELVTYAKTKELIPGEAQELTLSFPVVQMASYYEQKAAYALEVGDYLIRVGNSSRNTNVACRLLLDEEIVVRKLRNFGGDPGFTDEIPKWSPICCPDDEKQINAPKIHIDASEYITEVCTYYDEFKTIPDGEAHDWEQVKSGEISLEQFIGGLTRVQLVNLAIGDYKENGEDLLEIIGNASTQVAGAAGETSGKLSKLHVPSLIMADGPAGLRLNTIYKMEGDEVKLLNYVFEEGHRPLEVSDSEVYYYQYATAIPIGTALAQTWNDEAAIKCGDIVGDEMERFGIDVWLAPALNIHRSPLCGRNFEYYSEDPLLAGRMAAGVTEGVQRHPGCAVTLKHFACNNQETNRVFSNSQVSERAMREIYLKGFEYCVKKSQPYCIMSSYNLINGVHACNRRDLITSVLRDEWGFQGAVMTDWLVTGGLGMKDDKWDVASAAGNVKAGNDITMPGTVADRDNIMEALEAENHPYALTIAELQQCAKRVLTIILKLL